MVSVKFLHNTSKIIQIACLSTPALVYTSLSLFSVVNLDINSFLAFKGKLKNNQMTGIAYDGSNEYSFSATQERKAISPKNKNAEKYLQTCGTSMTH